MCHTSAQPKHQFKIYIYTCCGGDNIKLLQPIYLFIFVLSIRYSFFYQRNESVASFLSRPSFDANKFRMHRHRQYVRVWESVNVYFVTILFYDRHQKDGLHSFIQQKKKKKKTNKRRNGKMKKIKTEQTNWWPKHNKEFHYLGAVCVCVWICSPTSNNIT